MALLDLVQGVCDEVGLPRPSAVAASSEQLARQMFSLANAELKELSKKFEWPLLQREYTFATVATTEAYALPADFRALIGQTLYNSSQYFELKGSVSAQEWQHTKAMNLGSLSRARVRISGSPSMLRIVPVPTGVENVVYEYLTNKFAVNQAGAAVAKYTVDTDTSAVDEDLVRMGLKWRIKHAKGLEFSADLSEYQNVVAREFARALAPPAIIIGGSPLGDAPELTSGYTRENGFGV